jgi:hypothetical protein
VDLYPAPRSLVVEGLGARVDRACVEVEPGPERARVEAWAAELLDDARIAGARPGTCDCDWTVRVGALGEMDRYRVTTRTVAGRAETTVAAGGARAALWGLRAAIASHDPTTRRVADLALDDAPVFPHRGVLESYYGTPYAKAERRALLGLASRLRHDTYIYGPKLDPYTRELWAAPYPADRADAIRDAAGAARDGAIDFVWAVSPGLTYDFARHAAELPRLVAKVESVRALGVRRFALFLDDILNLDAHAHARLMNDLDDHLKAVDPASRLVVVGWSYAITPTPYTDVLGAALHPDIEVLWTGPGIYSPTMRAADMRAINASLRRKVGIWDNWPDRPVALTGRSADLPAATVAFYSNPVVNEWNARPARAFWETIGPLADYAWDPARYAGAPANAEASRRRWLDRLAEIAP